MAPRVFEAPPHPRLSTVVEWYSSLPSPLLLLSAGILAALVWWGPWALVQAGFASQKMFSSLLAYFLAFYLLVAVPASYSIAEKYLSQTQAFYQYSMLDSQTFEMGCLDIHILLVQVYYQAFSEQVDMPLMHFPTPLVSMGPV